MKKSSFVGALGTTLSLALAACNSSQPAPAPKADEAKAAPATTTALATQPAQAKVALATAVDPVKLIAFQPLPAVMESEQNPITAEKVQLGRMLYFEKRLSKNQDVSCNSCHGLDTYGVDNKPTSTGHKQQLGGRNSPTVYNAAFHVAQFWDGRAATVEEQAKGPLVNPVEMASNEKLILATLKSIPEYVAAFKAAFPAEKNPVTLDNLAKSIGAFERKLVTPSRWDKFLGGDQTALTAEEKAGFNAFMDNGCMACHMGPGLGGQMFQKLGLAQPWPNAKDQGRFEVTKAESDKMMFKVPSLRNIAKTAPYYHDGSIATLDEAVQTMAKHQLGKDLNEEQTKAIVTFLGALTGDLPTSEIQAPELPKSTAKTPKPDPT